MTVRINRAQCNGCGHAGESNCVRVCPGNLLYKDGSNKAVLREPRDCWDCAACVKECPNGAIELFLPAQIGGRGSTLKASQEKDRITWRLQKPNGDEEVFTIKTRER